MEGSANSGGRHAASPSYDAGDPAVERVAPQLPEYIRATVARETPKEFHWST